ncbi:MAG: dNTP triphosphohydrolase [Bryobacterales bacterium]|nr:dNTP triphosphohydrolase [Bryobacterales bacterium]
MLSQLRFPDEQSLLRRHAEIPDPDSYRGPFQHDRDRVIHSRAFRRLAGKTQVATLPNSNHSRTRLTHTIEVSQVARTVATALGLNMDLVEVLALAHDLGHPAFGHAGETALDAQMRLQGSFFDHNFHALRIVEHFERRYAAFRGLNLTFEVREGLLKHSRELDPAEPAHREYFPELRPTLEAQLLDSADEIAYLSADLEDAVTDKFLTVSDICAAVPKFGELRADVQAKYPGAPARRILNEAQRRLMAGFVRGLVEGTRSAAAAAGVSSWQDVRHLPARIAVPSEETAGTMRQLRSLLYSTYYRDSARIARERGFSSQLTELFQHYLEHPEALPSSYVEQLASEPLHQLVCDYIAGMTDEFLIKCHHAHLGGGGHEALAQARS